MRIVIIATDSAEIGEILMDLARADGFAPKRIKPRKEVLFDALKKISQLQKIREVRIHADKPIADYAENAKPFFKFEINILPIDAIPKE